MKLRNWSNCLIPWILLFVFKGQDCNIQERGHGRFTPNMLWCSLTTYCQPIFSLHYMIDDLSRQLSWVSRFQFALLESGWVHLKTAEPLSLISCVSCFLWSSGFVKPEDGNGWAKSGLSLPPLLRRVSDRVIGFLWLYSCWWFLFICFLSLTLISSVSHYMTP